MCQSQTRQWQALWPSRTNLHTIPYGGGESTSKPPALPHRGTSSTTATVPRRSIAKLRCNRRLHTYANRKSGSSKLFGRAGPTYTPYHMVVESRPPNILLCLIENPSSTTATVPRRSIAKLRCNHRLHTYANRKSGSSKLFGRAGATYIPYHMVVESRPPNLLLCLIGAPLRLRRRYHADPLLNYAAIVVYTHMPIANQAVASSLAEQDQPTHHTIWWWRVDLQTSCFASSGHRFDYGDGTTPIIHCCITLQSSTTH